MSQNPAKPTAPAGLGPRQAAARLLVGVLEDGAMLSELLPKLSRFPAEERARAQRLATGTLRQLDRCDRVLGPHLRKRPAPAVMSVLRLGAYEICAEGAPAHGVVNSAVEIMRANPKTKHLSGLVNAVLRRVGEEGPAAWAKLPAPRLPKWLRKPLIDDYGKGVVEAMEAVQAAPAPLDLTAKGDAGALAARLGGELLPTGSVRLAEFGQVSALEGYDAGDWWVQDAAAALPARILAPAPGQRVLDMCAAPGGKTMQLAAMGAEVTALDDNPKRMERLRENLARTGLAAETVVADGTAWQGGAFDAVLLDAPCTATGTIRRHPDLPHAKDAGSFPELFALQEQMIDHALSLLKPGGRLVYCTCSLLIDEGEEQLRDALGRHENLAVDRDALMIPGVDPAWITPDGGLRLRPDFWAERGGMDGFFITALRKS